MKSKVLILSIALLSLSACTTNSQSVPAKAVMADVQAEKQRYTAYNIWLLPKRQLHNFKVINYKLKNVPILPAGTAVNKITVLNKSKINGAQREEPYIRFSTMDGKSHKITFINKFHPEKTAKDYESLMFSTMNFTEQTSAMTANEIESIKAGVIREGMSKPAVLMSYGYPPEHRTPGLMESPWIYWMSKTRTKNICFDEQQKAARCGGKQEYLDAL